jgi:hypothetical protein
LLRASAWSGLQVSTIKKCANSGISSREGESSGRSTGARLRDYHFDLLYAGGAMIDAPPADSFNPNKEIDFDSP